MKVNIVCIGKIKEGYYVDAIAEYQKRLTKYCDFKIIELAEITQKEAEAGLKIEGEAIIKVAKGQVYIFDIGGQMLSSEELSEEIKSVKDFKGGEISFIIGSSCGLSSAVKRMGKSVSFGKVTYPHQLMRVIAIEQIYRAFTIIGGLPYHK